MSYHPIMGITILVIFIVLSFILGNKINIKKYKKKLLKMNKKNNIKTDSIAPDADWIE